MSRLESLADAYADIMNEARECLTWTQKQRLMKTIEQRLEAERAYDDEDEAA